jgi:Zn-dependent protease/CBS domain-containing protein
MGDMNPTISLGRIGGVQVGINWSWLVVFALIVWTLAAGVFPAENEGLSDATYVAMGIVAAILFFGCILLHEMGHAIQARREGMQIEGITLWLFGGVARFKGMFPSAGAELRIGLAGPAVSLVLGGIFVGVAAAIPGPEPVDAVSAWIGFINWFLLLFNMIPALPLDGGRVFRALMWLRSGDFTRATRTAGAAGRGFGYLMIAAGILLVVFVQDISGLWLVFLGWFLMGAAQAELQAVLTQEAIGDLRVRDLMTRDPVTTVADVTLGHFVDHIVWPNRYTTYPVVEDGRPVGLLPFRHVAEVPREQWDEREVADCMIPVEEVPVVGEDTPASEALQAIGTSRARRALVVEEGRLVGLISVTDLVRALETPRPRHPVSR